MSVRVVADDTSVRIVVGHDNENHWWWTAFADDGTIVARSVIYASRSDCIHSIAELKVEGPVASVGYDDSDSDAATLFTVLPRPAT